MHFYLFVWCFLFIGQTSISFGKNIATTNKPSTLDDNQLINIQTKLLEIQDDIISITAAMGIAETLDSINDKIAATEEEFQHIKEELDSERQKQQDAGECNKDAHKLLFNQFNAVNGEIKNLQSSLKAFKEKRLPSDTIADIKAHRFGMAEQKLKQMKNYKDVLKIVRDVYGGCLENSDLLAKLIENLTDINVINFSVRALREEMTRNDHKDPYKWMRLAKKLETGLINQPNVEYKTNQLAQSTHSELKDAIKEFTLEALNVSVSKGHFERNGKLYNLTSEIYLFDPLLSESIIKEFVNTNYGMISSKKILGIIQSHKYIQQRVQGVSSLFWNIKKADNLNSDVTIKIASALHELRSNKDFDNLNKTQQAEVEKLIDNLPTCARNLFFLPSVCFWNKEKEEYLTAGDLSSKYDKSRRNIFSVDPVPQSHWYVNTTGDNFLFSSRSYDSEYLYAAAFTFNEDLRYVFNWIPGSNTDKQSEWSIELNDDYCYIKSAAYNEYLFSSNHKRPDGKDLRYVFTWVPGNSVRESKFQWQIRNCD